MRTSLLVGAAALALSAGTVLAQNATTTTSPPASSSSTMSASPGAAPATADAPKAPMPDKAPNFVSIDSADILSSNVVGLDIYNDQNNDIGKVQDIAFDSSKKIMGYVLSVGGFLGMGTRYIAVDPDSVKVTYDAGNKVWRATMNATKDQLKAAPEFKYEGQWNASRS
jgi:sporulation protein YlmC with PRC-barrel domain